MFIFHFKYDNFEIDFKKVLYTCILIGMIIENTIYHAM